MTYSQTADSKYKLKKIFLTFLRFPIAISKKV